jgi:hypothetical protein
MVSKLSKDSFDESNDEEEEFSVDSRKNLSKSAEKSKKRGKKNSTSDYREASSDDEFAKEHFMFSSDEDNAPKQSKSKTVCD